MAKQDTFKVSSRTHTGFTVSNSRVPETIEEFISLNMVSAESDVVDLAYQNWVIKAQARARGKLDEGQEAVQKAVDEYKYGARIISTTTRAAPVKLTSDKVKELRFTRAQLEALKAAGAQIEGFEPAEEAAA